jgi:hypothetical protein
MLPFTLAAVHYHPQPVDDCPCFEDAIAVLAVVLGTFTGHWYWARQPFPALCFQRLYGEESVVKAIFVGFLRVAVGKSSFFLPVSISLQSSSSYQDPILYQDSIVQPKFRLLARVSCHQPESYPLTRMFSSTRFPNSYQIFTPPIRASNAIWRSYSGQSILADL